MKELKFASPIRTAAILLILVICFVILAWAQDVIVPLLFAIIFSSMLFPICLRLEKWGVHKGLASFSSILVAGLLLALFLGIVISQLLHLVNQAPQFLLKINSLADRAETYINSRWHIDKSTQVDHIHAQVGKLLDNSSSYFSSTMSFTTNFHFSIPAGPAVQLFPAVSAAFFLEFFYKYSPPRINC